MTITKTKKNKFNEIESLGKSCLCIYWNLIIVIYLCFGFCILEFKSLNEEDTK